MGGWITLTLSCLAGILLHFLSLFGIPVVVAHKLELCMISFGWGKDSCKIKGREEEGWGVGSW